MLSPFVVMDDVRDGPAWRQGELDCVTCIEDDATIEKRDVIWGEFSILCSEQHVDDLVDSEYVIIR